MPSPRVVLSASALVFAVLGVALLFLPVEAARLLGMGPGTPLPLQLFSAGLLAMASLDWFGRGAIYGGIYGRPLVLANFAFGTIVAGSLISALRNEALEPWGWIVAGVFAAHAVVFFVMMRRPPWTGEGPGEEARR